MDITKKAQILIDNFKLNDYISNARISFFYKSVPRTFLIVYDSKNPHKVLTKAMIRNYGNIGIYRDGEKNLLDFTPPIDLIKFGGNIHGIFIVLDMGSSIRLKGRSPYALDEKIENNYEGLKVYKLEEKEIVFTPEYANDILERMEKIPEGWYVHGRTQYKKFGNTDWPTQFTRDIEVANSYGRNGFVWIAKPNKNAVVLDFTDTNTKDMDEFIDSLKKYFDEYVTDGDTVMEVRQIIDDISGSTGVRSEELEWDDFEDNIRTSFAPDRIVETAQAYDNPDWINLLSLYSGRHDKWPDFVKTPDGAVMIPGSIKNIEAYNLTEIASQLNENYNKYGDYYDPSKSIDFSKYIGILKSRYGKYDISIQKAKTTKSIYGIMSRSKYTKLTGFEFPERWPKYDRSEWDDYFITFLRMADHDGDDKIINYRPDASDSDIEDAEGFFGYSEKDDHRYFRNDFNQVLELLDNFFKGNLELPK